MQAYWQEWVWVVLQLGVLRLGVLGQHHSASLLETAERAALQAVEILLVEAVADQVEGMAATEEFVRSASY